MDRSNKGQPRFSFKPEEKLPYSLISIVASDADFDNLEKQIKDTIDFLKNNKSKLELITATKEIQYATLDFGVEDNNNEFTQTMRLPNELLRLAADLGMEIEMSVYR
ncbi:hypothetical protein D3C80_602240 [compost metagenome]